MKYVSAKTVTKMLGVTAQTVRNWDRTGVLEPAYVKNNGYRYYTEDSILAFTQERKYKKDLDVVIYARVCEGKEAELDAQVEKIKTAIAGKYDKYEIITDVASSFDYERDNLKKLISMINRKEVDIIVIEHKSRLLSVGYELIEYFAKINNTKIEVIEKIDRTDDEEICQEYIAESNVFLSKLKCKNRNRLRTLISENCEKIEKTKKK